MWRVSTVGTFGLLVLFALSLLACGGGGGGGGATTFSLAVSGTPANAIVYVNGQRVDNPQQITLPPGTHRIRVEIVVNGQVIAQEFTIRAGEVSSIQYDLSRYQIVVEPAQVELFEGAEATVSATLRNTATNTEAEATFTWSTLDPTIATVQPTDARTARVVGVRAGATKLKITDTRTNLTTEVPISVRVSEYTIEVRPQSLEVWVDEVITVSATVRHRTTGETVQGDLQWQVVNPSLASVQATGANTAQIRGVQRGNTQLRVIDRRTGARTEVPLRVLDFPPPPN